MERSSYRIIDANFNRAREAVRVVEEYCRFALNCECLTQRAKQLRHNLCDAVGKFDAARLITSRNTPSDVGVGLAVDNQLSRANLLDCFTAASKRLTEALRAIAEVGQTINPAAARIIEDLRYAAYTLEKDIAIFSSTAEKFKKVKLYVIITSNNSQEVLRLTESCAAGGAECIQLRPKGIEDDAFFALAADFVRACAKYGVISIINDRADITIAAAADGVHLGQNDLPIETVRALQLTPLITGKTTHNEQQLADACCEMPTYVSLGPVFATTTKPELKPVGVDYVSKSIKKIAPLGISYVAIGGIDLKNIDQLLHAGVAKFAACSAVTKAADPAAVCRAFKQKIDDFCARASS